VIAKTKFSLTEGNQLSTFFMIVDSEIINHLVTETNSYAHQPHQTDIEPIHSTAAHDSENISDDENEVMTEHDVLLNLREEIHGEDNLIPSFSTISGTESLKGEEMASSKWQDVDYEEIKHYLAVFFAMGLNHQPSLKDYG
jgi:hypothetical protein